MSSTIKSEVRFAVKEGPDGEVSLIAEGVPADFPTVTLLLRSDVSPQLAQEAANFINRHVDRLGLTIALP